MTLSSPGLVKDQDAERALNSIRQEFPLGAQHLQDGVALANLANGSVPLAKLASGTSAQIIVCNSSGVPTYVTASGDATVSNAGVISLGTNVVTQLYTTTASTSGPNTTSAADPMTATIPEMSVTADFLTNPLVIIFTASIDLSGAQAANTGHIALYDDSAEIGTSRRTFQSIGNAVPWVLSTAAIYTPATGSRTISVRWRTGGGTLTARGTNRELLIVRLKH